MESKVIEQGINENLYIVKVANNQITIKEDGNTCYIDILSLPDLIAALQSFLPKETE